MQVEAAQPSSSAATDIHQMEATEEAPNMAPSHDESRVKMGKPSGEGQASEEMTEEAYGKIATEQARKKEVRREMKEAFRDYREAIKNRQPDSPADDGELLLYVILAILLPPLAVGLYTQGLTTEFWICLLLTLLFYLPGLIYALLVIFDAI